MEIYTVVILVSGRHERSPIKLEAVSHEHAMRAAMMVARASDIAKGNEQPEENYSVEVTWSGNCPDYPIEKLSSSAANSMLAERDAQRLSSGAARRTVI